MAEPTDTQHALELAKQERVRFLRLQFTDIQGSIKNVEVPEHQFKRALDGQVVFDGSSPLLSASFPGRTEGEKSHV